VTSIKEVRYHEKKHLLRQPHTPNLKIIISQNSTKINTIYKENNNVFIGDIDTFEEESRKN